MSERRLSKDNDLLRVTTRSQYVSELGSFTRRKTHVETHIFRLKTSLYEVERRGSVLCGNEGASVPRG